MSYEILTAGQFNVALARCTIKRVKTKRFKTGLDGRPYEYDVTFILNDGGELEVEPFETEMEIVSQDGKHRWPKIGVRRNLGYKHIAHLEDEFLNFRAPWQKRLAQKRRQRKALRDGPLLGPQGEPNLSIAVTQ